MDMKVDIPF